MGDHIGIRRFCSLCKYAEIENEDITCKNKESSFHNMNTRSILLAPCFQEKDRKGNTEVEYVSLGD